MSKDELARAEDARSAPATTAEGELLAASPDDYWGSIVAEIEAAGVGIRHARLLNHQAAHLLAWAKIARDSARRLSRDGMTDIGERTRKMATMQAVRFYSCQTLVDAFAAAAAEIDRLRAVPSPKAEGWVLVPREPTEEMLVASEGAINETMRSLGWSKAQRAQRWSPRAKIVMRWAAMLDAAPSPPVAARGGVGHE